MANTQLFATSQHLLPPSDSINEAGGSAYVLPPEMQLAQFLMTGTLNGTFYADAQAQLDAILSLAEELDAEFLAKAAIYARARGHMKDPPALFRCVDKAGLIAAAILRRNPLAAIVAFNTGARELELNPRDSVVTNSGKIAGLVGGGTAISSAFALLNGKAAQGDTVILVSDNQSWADTRDGATETMRQWEAFRQRNRSARLVCIDLQPYRTVQTAPREDVLHVGGFSDAVFDLLASYSAGQMGSDFWIREIEEVKLD